MKRFLPHLAAKFAIMTYTTLYASTPETETTEQNLPPIQFFMSLGISANTVRFVDADIQPKTDSWSFPIKVGVTLFRRFSFWSRGYFHSFAFEYKTGGKRMDYDQGKEVDRFESLGSMKEYSLNLGSSFSIIHFLSNNQSLEVSLSYLEPSIFFARSRFNYRTLTAS